MTSEFRMLVNLAQPWARSDAVRAAADALAAGCDGVGLAESPRLFRDPFVETEAVLTATEVSLAGPCVASLGLRHPATVAAAVSTLAARHPGRVLTVVGRGESSVRNEGLPVPGLRAHGAALLELRERLGDIGAPETQSTDPGPLVLGAASGPRTIAATVRALGGVLLDSGADPAVLRQAVMLARETDAAAEVWLFLRAVITSTEADAVAAAEPILGSCAARLVTAPEWHRIDPADLAEVTRVADAHDYRRHGSPAVRGGRTGPGDAQVRDRFVLTGSAEDIRARLAPLADLPISGVVLAGALAGVSGSLPELVPAVRVALRGSLG